MRVALRTQQIIAEETGVTNTIDPLGGSYFVEALTDRMEAQAYEYFAQDRRARRDGRGGQAGFPQREIADAAFSYQREVEAGVRKVVGVNAYTEGDDERPRPADRPGVRARAGRPRASAFARAAMPPPSSAALGAIQLPPETPPPT